MLLFLSLFSHQSACGQTELARVRGFPLHRFPGFFTQKRIRRFFKYYTRIFYTSKLMYIAESVAQGWGGSAWDQTEPGEVQQLCAGEAGQGN
jgi:hypothetical protein